MQTVTIVRITERLLSRGPHALTDAERLAILIDVGVQGKSVVALGWEWLERSCSMYICALD